MLQPEFEMQLEDFDGGAPAPIAVGVYDTFHLARADLRDVAVLRARAKRALAPITAYFQDKILVKRAAQISRLKAARYFYPLHIKSEPATEADIRAMEQFNMIRHPRVSIHYENMFNEIKLYNQLASEIKPLCERQVTKRKADGTEHKVDTFNIREWWLGVEQRLPATFEMVRIFLLHCPNSAAVERLFSVLNDTFNSDQRRSYGDYVELSMKLQYNNRTRP